MPLEEGQLDSQCLRSGPLLWTILHFLLDFAMARSPPTCSNMAVRMFL